MEFLEDEYLLTTESEESLVKEIIEIVDLNKIIFVTNYSELNLFPIVELLTPIENSQLTIKGQYGENFDGSHNIKIRLDVWLNEIGTGFFYETLKYILHNNCDDEDWLLKNEMIEHNKNDQEISQFVREHIIKMTEYIDSVF